MDHLVSGSIACSSDIHSVPCSFMKTQEVLSSQSPFIHSLIHEVFVTPLLCLAQLWAPSSYSEGKQTSSSFFLLLTGTNTVLKLHMLDVTVLFKLLQLMLNGPSQVRD